MSNPSGGCSVYRNMLFFQYVTRLHKRNIYLYNLYMRCVVLATTYPMCLICFFLPYGECAIAVDGLRKYGRKRGKY